MPNSCTLFCSAHTTPNFLVMTMMAPLLRLYLWFLWQQAWKLPSTTLFALDPSFGGHKVMVPPPHQRHPQIPWITGTGMPNLNPFFHFSSFDQTFE